MLLKDRVAIYGILHDHKLSYDEIIDKMNWKHWLFLKVMQKGEPDTFVRIPEGATFRDIEMFAKGMKTFNNNIEIERTNYIV